jgi:hypothetical protein
MSVKAIGAGFGRTGTDSLREALTILGFGPCHHMFEVNAHEEQRRLWRALAQGAAPDWDRLLAGYNACVDWPSAFYWRELMAHFPDAKVISTYRSSQSWWDSFEKTLLAFHNQNVDPESLGATLIARQVFGGRTIDRSHAIACYETNVKSVKEAVPADRLLVHNLGEGWDSLCAHLGVPIPTKPYPNRNSAAELKAKFNIT